MPTLTEALTGRHLLDHPYYRSWQEGALTAEDIGRYAGQYRHFERVLPEVLAETAALLPPSAARRLVQANLDDEQSSPTHLELFNRFATSVGAPPEAPAGDRTRALVDLYRDAVAAGPVAALSVIAAYESQASAIAATKGASLRLHLGLEPAATEFWDVHAEIEADHSAWTMEALRSLDAPEETVTAWAKASADAWWAFLDEQQDALAGSAC